MSTIASKFSNLPPQTLPAGVIAVVTRVSTDEQAKGDSIENQHEVCCRFYRAHQEVFGDREIVQYSDPGHTGTTFDREKINQLRADIRAGKIACILVRDLKRLGRNAKEGLEFLDEITAAGVQLIDIGQPSIDYTTTKGRKIFTDAMSSAEAECGTYRDSSIQGQTARAQKGNWKGGTPTYAYDLKDGLLVPVGGPCRVLVLAIKDIYLEQKSPVAVLKELHKRGIHFAPVTPRPFQEANRVARGYKPSEPKQPPKPQLITIRFIRDILRNPVYAGYVPAPRAVNHLTVELVPDLILPDGRRFFKGGHEAIFTNSEWDEMQAISRSHARPDIHKGRESPDYLLQELVHCGCCHRPLFVSGATSGTGKFIRHYVCSDIRRLGSESKCTLRRVPAEAIETAILRFLSNLPKNPSIIQNLTALANEGKADLINGFEERVVELEKERSVLEKTKKIAITRLLEFQGKEIGEEVQKVYKTTQQKLDAVLAEVADLRQKLSTARMAAPSPALVASALSDFEILATKLSASSLKELVQLLVGEVVIAKLDHTSMPRYKLLRTSSRVLKLDISLNASGLHMSGASSSPQPTKHRKGHSPKLMPSTVIVEVRQSGSKGNVVRLLEPFATEAELFTFPSRKDGADEDVQRRHHPIYRIDAMLEMQKQGLLKKQIAKKYGKEAPWVTYHFRLLQLLPAITQKLKTSPLSVLSHFGLVLLMKLAVMDAEAQRRAFDKTYAEAIRMTTSSNRD